MGVVGIIVNPHSGKDVRRLVSQATVFDNGEKRNIVVRAIRAIKAYGNAKIYLMPDGYFLSETIIRTLKDQGISENVEILDMEVNENSSDTSMFTKHMRQMGADVIIVLGGDGTSRAAAKESGDVPVIAVSTGTNNVFPDFVEGTSAGMAAAILAGGIVSREEALVRCKKISISRNGEFRDIALIDAVISNRTYVGAKAIWNLTDMREIIVTQGHPATIGFSSLAGACAITRPKDEFGYLIRLGGGTGYRASIAAGVVEEFGVSMQKKLMIGEKYTFRADSNGTVAVDGEREVSFKAGDVLAFEINFDGPYRVDVLRTIDLAHENGFFKINNIKQAQRSCN